MSQLWGVFRLISPGTGILDCFVVVPQLPLDREYQFFFPASLKVWVYVVLLRLYLKRTGHKNVGQEDKMHKRAGLKPMKSSENKVTMSGEMNGKRGQEKR